LSADGSRNDDRSRGRWRALMSGGVNSLNKVTIGGPAPDVAIDVAGSRHARRNRFESPVELAAINVVPGYGYAWLGTRRVPLEDNAMRSSAGYGPEEHHADGPQQKDHQDCNGQA
jgi:hypothetical protein